MNVPERLWELCEVSTWAEFSGIYRDVAKAELEEIASQFFQLDADLEDHVRTDETLRHSTAGGKKLRGSLVLVGFQCSGRSDLQNVLNSSIAYELIHSSFLIHDDIMDSSPLRHGDDAAHIKYQKLGEELGLSNPEQFGRSMAINAGDAGPAIAYGIVCREMLEPRHVLAGIQHLSAVIQTTVMGQCLDVGTTIDRIPTPTEKEILRIHRLKTANYTVAGPLQFGALLSGIENVKDDALLHSMEEYGFSIGIAYQIQDDFMGMFGTTEDSGKPITSDLEEKKNTLLFQYLLLHGSDAEKTFLRSLLGTAAVSTEDFEGLKTMLLESGAVDYSRQKARDLVESGKAHVPEITTDQRLRHLLVDIADWSISRIS